MDCSVNSSAFNRLGQYASSNRAYYYAELAVFFPAGGKTIFTRQYSLRIPQRDGQAELT